MSVSIQDFGKSTSGQTVKLATLKNDFIEVQLLSYAAIIHRKRPQGQSRGRRAGL